MEQATPSAGDPVLRAKVNKILLQSGEYDRLVCRRTIVICELSARICEDLNLQLETSGWSAMIRDMARGIFELSLVITMTLKQNRSSEER